MNMHSRIHSFNFSSTTNSTSSPTSFSPKVNKWEKVKDVIALVTLVAFNVFAFWGCPPLYGFFFGCGVFANIIGSKWVQENISAVFNNILWKGGWKWIVPTAIPLYTVLLPATLIMQAVFAGADMGSRISLAARDLLGKSFLSLKPVLHV